MQIFFFSLQNFFYKNMKKILFCKKKVYYNTVCSIKSSSIILKFGGVKNENQNSFCINCAFVRVIGLFACRLQGQGQKRGLFFKLHKNIGIDLGYKVHKGFSDSYFEGDFNHNAFLGLRFSFL